MIYVKKDYKLFIQSDINLDLVSKNIHLDEELIPYNDIVNDNYKKLFYIQSPYIRNTSIYSEPLPLSKIVQLYNQKNLIEPKSLIKTPIIVRNLFGSNISIQTYNSMTDYSTLDQILTRYQSEYHLSKEKFIGEIRHYLETNNEMVVIYNQFMNESLTIDDIQQIQSIDSYKINPIDLYILSKLYSVGFVVVTDLFSITENSQVYLCVHPDVEKQEDINLIILYQTSSSLSLVRKQKKFL